MGGSIELWIIYILKWAGCYSYREREREEETQSMCVCEKGRGTERERLGVHVVSKHMAIHLKLLGTTAT